MQKPSRYNAFSVMNDNLYINEILKTHSHYVMNTDRQSHLQEPPESCLPRVP